MGTPRIQYSINGDSINIDFDEDLSNLQIAYPRTLLKTTTDTGIDERFMVRQDCIVIAEWDIVTDSQSAGGGSNASMKRKLRNFFSLASSNTVTWTFATNSDETVLTKLSANVSAGATSVIVQSPVGITVGKRYVIRNEFDIAVVEVDSITGVVVELTNPIPFNFTGCTRFRSEEFWSGIFIIDQDPVVELPPLHYGIRWQFRELFECT